MTHAAALIGEMEVTLDFEAKETILSWEDEAGHNEKRFAFEEKKGAIEFASKILKP